MNSSTTSIMHQPVLVLHLILCASFSVFLLGYFESLYPDNPICLKREKCKFTTRKYANSSLLFCTGIQECCDLLDNRVNNFTASYNVFFSQPLTVSFILIAIAAGLYFGVTLFSFLNHHRNILNLASGIFLLTIVILYLSVIFIISLALFLDWSYYSKCQMDLVLSLNWAVLCLILFLDFIFSYWPAIKMRKEKTHKMKQALFIEDVEESAHLLSSATSLSLPFQPCRRLVKVLACILLLWWIMVTIYFIGVGQGRWNFVV